MKSLSQFQGNQQVFKDAEVLPDFFQNNLINPARVVKTFINDPQGHIRIFYYQYLKLCFELENINYDFYIQKFEEIINSNFHFIFYPDDDPAIFNDIQAKSLIMEFFGVLGQGGFTVQKALCQYPIMDYIFVNFFRSLLIEIGKTDSIDSYLSRDQILGFLCPKFGVAVQIHSQCIKYVQTDIFVYEQNPHAIYMAYMEYDQQNENIAEVPVQPKQQQIRQDIATIPVPVQKVQQTAANVAVYSKAPIPYQRNSYVATQFTDFTNLYSNSKDKQIQSPLNQKSISQNQSNFLKQQNKEIIVTQSIKVQNTNSQINFNKNILNLDNQTQNQQLKKSLKINTEFSNNDSNIKYSEYPPTKDIYSAISPIATNQSNYIPYSPYKYTPTQKEDNEAYKSIVKNTTSNLMPQPKKEPYYNPVQYTPYNSAAVNYNKIQSPKVNNVYGSFTKKKTFGLNVSSQFTNSLIMKSMPEPYRSNVYHMRSRARNFRDSLSSYIK